MSMILTDRKIVKLSLYHPSSSLIITNPSNELALMFEVIKFYINSQISVTQQFNEKNQSLAETLFGVTHFEISPIRGIILPNDSQLIKISVPTSHLSKIKIPRKAQPNSPLQYEVAQVDIKCSNCLQYNKQKIAQSYSHKNDTKFQFQEVLKTETNYLKIFIQTGNINSQYYEKRMEVKNSMKNSKQFVQQSYDKETQKVKSKSLIEQFRRNIGQINVNTLTSSNYMKDLKEHQNVSLKNSKLNEDYDLVRNKVTLNDIQRKKQNQMFKLFEKQISPIEDNILSSKAPLTTFNVQDKKLNHSKNGIRTPPFIKKNEMVDESIVIQTFKPNPFLSKVNSLKTTNRTIQIIILAIIAAVFVSLGANFKLVFYE